MFLNSIDIRDDSYVTDLVTQDYRFASVFRKYGIDYCCGGKRSLQEACRLLGLDLHSIRQELRDAIRVIHVPASIDFKDWSVDFLVDYILNVHHAYLERNLGEIVETVNRFVEAHQSKYSFLPELSGLVNELHHNILPHLEEEEKIIFPYIRQIAHAYESREPYAALLVRTLRKPVENVMDNEHEFISKYLHRVRALTNNYDPASNACISHKVAFFKLKELDNDLVQHVHLEGNILFPKAISMEREMLSRR